MDNYEEDSPRRVRTEVYYLRDSQDGCSAMVVPHSAVVFKVRNTLMKSFQCRPELVTVKTNSFDWLGAALAETLAECVDAAHLAYAAVAGVRHKTPAEMQWSGCLSLLAGRVEVLFHRYMAMAVPGFADRRVERDAAGTAVVLRQLVVFLEMLVTGKCASSLPVRPRPKGLEE